MRTYMLTLRIVKSVAQKESGALLLNFFCALILYIHLIFSYYAFCPAKLDTQILTPCYSTK